MADQAGGLWARLSVEPPRPDAVRTSRLSEWLIVATVCVGAFMGQLDASIVTVTLPTLRRVFHASLHDVEWVALAYLVVLVAAVVAVGRLGDVVGRKLLYTYGFAVFTVATVGCGLAPTLGTLVAARVVQALGAAMLQANSVALIITSLPVSRRARGLGIQGAAQAVGLAVGPTVGGVLPASLGALVAAIAVLILGIILRKPAAAVPENAMKIVVGVMLLSFGTFWVGEAAGIKWPLEDTSLFGLVALYAAIVFGSISALKVKPAA